MGYEVHLDRGPVERRHPQVLNPDTHDGCLRADLLDPLPDHDLEPVGSEQRRPAGGELMAEPQQHRGGVATAERGGAVASDEVTQPVGVGAGERGKQAGLAGTGLGHDQEVAAAGPLEPLRHCPFKPVAADAVRCGGVRGDQVVVVELTTAGCRACHDAYSSGGRGRRDGGPIRPNFPPVSRASCSATSTSTSPTAVPPGHLVHIQAGRLRAAHPVGPDPADHDRAAGARPVPLGGEGQRLAGHLLDEVTQLQHRARQFGIGAVHVERTIGVVRQLGEAERWERALATAL